jgi:phospholipid-binding lipoprotein MlaA
LTHAARPDATPSGQGRAGLPGGARQGRRLWAGALTAALPLLAAGCADKPPASDPDAVAEYEQTNDPLEPTNRFFYRVDDTLQRYTLKPVAEGYIAVVPGPARSGIHNFLSNLGTPVVLANDVAEAKSRRAGTTFMRFMINSTAGVLGVFDVAKSLGYKAHDAGFNQTLGVWGVGPGPYLYLPIIGPNSPRSVVGFAMDQATDPFSYVPKGIYLHTFNWARYGLSTIDTYASILPDYEKEKAGALDPYATIRSLYRQHTQSEIEAARNADAITPPDWYAQ